MRHRNIAGAVGLLLAICGQALATSWLYVPLEQVVEERPLAVVGTVEKIERGDDGKGNRVELAVIRIATVLKNEASDPAVKAGGTVSLVLPDKKSPTGGSLRYEKGKKAVWMLLPVGKHYAVYYPGAVEVPDKEQAISEIIARQRKEQDAVREQVLAELKAWEETAAAVPLYTAKEFEADLGKTVPPEVDVNKLRSIYVTNEKSTDGWVFVDQAGRVQLATRHSANTDFSEGFAVAGTRINKGIVEDYRFIDRAGKIVFPEYSAGGSFRDGLAEVRKEGKVGAIDATGKLVIPFNYVSLYSFTGGLSRARKDWKGESALVVNREGKVLLEARSQDIGFPSEGLVNIEDHRSRPTRRGYMDSTGKLVLDLTGMDFQSLRPFHSGMAAVKSEGKWGYINREGKLMIAPRFADAGDFADGRAPVRIRDAGDGAYLWGYIDESGQLIAPAVFRSAKPFSEGLAAVEVESWVRASWSPTAIYRTYKWGFIDKTGKLAIPGRFSHAHSFRHGLARVDDENHSYGLIDATGRYVWRSKTAWQAKR